MGGLLAGVSGLARTAGIAHATAVQPRTKVTFAVPPGATDCAVHIYNDPKRHPFWEGRTYTPEPATVPELKQVMRALGLDRVVVVQASTYGTDNSIVVDSIRELGAGARGVAVIDDKTTEAALDEMHRGGVRGIRLSLGNQGATDLAAARQRLKIAGDRMKNRKGWSALISGSPATWDALRVDLAAFPCRSSSIISAAACRRRRRTAGIYGRPQSRQVRQGLRQLSTPIRLHSPTCRMSRRMRRRSRREPAAGCVWHGMAAPSAGAVAGRKSTDLALHRQTDDGQVLNMLAVWAPDAAMRKMILVDNPARLFGF